MARIALGIFTTILKNHKIRLTSLPEETKEKERKEERLASGEKREKRHKSKGKEETESKAGQEPTGAERGQMAGAVWIDSANVAGWLRGTRVMGDSYGTQNRRRLEKTMETLEVLTMHLGCEPFGTEWVYWIPREWNAAADSLATRAIKRREDAFFLNSRWHTDRWSQADVVIMSDAGTRDNPSRPGMKQQGMGFLMMHRSTRELLAAASFFVETRRKQDDMNILELMAVQAAVGMTMAVRAGEGRTVHKHASMRIHTTRDQDTQNQSGNMYTTR